MISKPPKKKPHKEKKKSKNTNKEGAHVPDTNFHISNEIPECSKYLRRRDDDDTTEYGTKKEATNLARSSEHQHNRKRKLFGAKEVLDEDTYNATLNHIITRNFYPDLKELRALTGGGGDTEDLLYRAPPHREGSKLSMSDFFKRYKSEDDHSYDLLTEREDRHDAKKKRWLLTTEAENQALRIEAATHPERGLLIPWKYEKRNSLFYTPGNAPLTLEEREDLGLIAGTNGDTPLSGSISLAGTRFQDAGNSTAEAGGTEVTLKQPVTRKDMLYSRLGMVNPDRVRKADEDVLLSARARESQTVEQGASPPVTWGKVVGAPVALAKLRTPVGDATPGPTFSLPAVSKREEIGNRLAEEANRAMRARKMGMTPGSPSMETLRRKTGACSPAVQSIVEKIAQKRRRGGSSIMGSADSQLRAFYSTPQSTPRLSQTFVKVKEEPKD